MKNKFRNQLVIVNYITSTDRFKLVFMLTIALGLYGTLVLGVSTNNYIDAFSIPFQFPWFNLFTFAMLFLNTLNTCSIISKELSNYIIRLKNKRNYFKELLKTVVLVNFFWFLLLLMICFICFLLFKTDGFIHIHSYLNYGINNLVYLLFHLSRYIIIGMFVMLISVICYINFGEKITLIFDSIFLLGFMTFLDFGMNTTGFSIYLWDYINGIQYISFVNELCYSLLIIFILEILFYILYKLTLKSRKWGIG